jgi:hypothetical protein
VQDPRLVQEMASNTCGGPSTNGLGYENLGDIPPDFAPSMKWRQNGDQSVSNMRLDCHRAESGDLPSN